MIIKEVGGIYMKKGRLQQILLITDGYSNRGEDPVAVARLAKKTGITVNVIGILEEEAEQLGGLREVEDIASSGGGMSQIVYKEALSQTVQMVTKQAMNQTIQGFVNKELSSILGEEKEMTDLSPDKRGEIMEVVEEIEESCDLEVLVLVDTSGSMRSKLETVKEAVMDLSISLNARIGDNQFSVYRFPSKRKDVEKVYGWSAELRSISSVFPKLTSGGITPTGPALKEAVKEFSKRKILKERRDDDEYGLEEAWG